MQLPAESELKDLIVRYAQLQTDLGGELGRRPLVLPNSQFFPDVFQASQAGLGRLLARMQRHAGMSDIPVAARVQLPSDEEAAEACNSLGCSKPAPQAAGPRLSANADGWELQLLPQELAHPVALTTVLSQALGAIFLEETRPDGATLRAPVGITVELAAVSLGFGPLLLEGSHIYSKSCGGPQVARLTQLGSTQLAVVTALFAAQHGHALKPALKLLSPTQKAALSLAHDWERSNRKLGAALAKEPAHLLSQLPELNEPAPPLLAFLSWKKAAADADADEDSLLQLEHAMLQAPARSSATKKSPEHDELRALVESELASVGAPQAR